MATPFQGLLLCRQLCGAALLAVGIWVSVDGPSFMKIFGPLSSSAMQFVNVGYFLIAAGAVLFALGFLGCYGAQTENKCALMMVCQTQLHRPRTKAQGRPLILDTRPWGSPSAAPDSGGSGKGGPYPVCVGGWVRARKACLPKTQIPVPPSVLLHPPPHLHCRDRSCCGRPGLHLHGEARGGAGRAGRATATSPTGLTRRPSPRRLSTS